MFEIDVQGLKYESGNCYMWKEITFFNMDTERYLHKMIKIPHQFEVFDISTQNHIN